MKIALTGGTGFVGKHLTNELLNNGHELYILTRSLANKSEKNNITYVQWLNKEDEPEKQLDGIDVFINLAGESINSGRWTKERKQKILDSRLTSTREVMRIINRLDEKPYTLINASAVGFYGTSQTAVFDEEVRKSGDDFLSLTVKAWEEEAMHAEKEWEIRTAFCRFGIILDKHEGALPRMALPYKLFAGGTIGDGEQWLSWIHIRDVVGAIEFIIKNESIDGPVNFTAPSPVTMKNFGKMLGKALNRPHWLPVPEPAIELALGEMSILITKGQKVLPSKLLKSGYQFHYSNLQTVLQAIYE
ncbi:uncharacterized protein ACUXCC_003209 [Cytobacillus horneckiae]|uniref:TIGR01777 family protein n=1 Tax=Cytobacillus horneckiae TaxID=549687 RepID=A0A2N0ZGJ1_9BACI|nr:TIGR01777 family oxidoreductase [Cytobacillus horneckiae]MBN6888286.1 TIGR01777 family oxidoreductase [Cytobacillus horneckiae]MEC1154840.1 TIGR01777 family oxidoreductase [Cytobacillus horneckiae]MED2940334.1 TIGR01777 family oxidoreductase [Cytobacillus horneckiae]PKG28635.1 TIGR01777 family protein [Cytobacillus horneckiae]